MARSIGVLIGMDGLGKTALCEMLDRFVGVETVRLINDPRALYHGQSLISAARETTRWDSAVNGWATLIYDRFPYPDEFIYGDALDNRNLRVTWDLMMQDYDVRFIYVNPPESMSEYLDMMKERPDNILGDMSTVALKIYHRYNQWLSSTLCSVLRVNHKHFEEEDARTILEFIRAPRLKGKTTHVMSIRANSPSATVSEASHDVPVRFVPHAPRA
jgi:hypothetical protein